MNERLKELAEQARQYASDYVANCKHYGYYMEHNEHNVKFEEKFAELLIKETIQIARVGMEFGPSMDEAVYTYFDLTPEIEYCPKCNAEWSGTSCGLDDCGWIK